MYEIYPCDLDPMGECPRHHQDCANCRCWFYSVDDDDEDDGDDEKESDKLVRILNNK